MKQAGMIRPETAIAPHIYKVLKLKCSNASQQSLPPNDHHTNVEQRKNDKPTVKKGQKFSGHFLPC